MSLYKNVESSVSGGGILNGMLNDLKSSVGGYAQSVVGQVSRGNLSGLNRGAIGANLAGIGLNVAGRAAGGALSSLGIPIPPELAGRLANTVNGLARQKMIGLVSHGGPRHGAFMETENPLMGGITPRRALEMFNELQAEQLSRKNLFSVSVTSALDGGAHDLPQKFHFFCTDVELQPFQMAGDKTQIGGAAADLLTGHEAVQVSLTTMDDAQGSLKRWFRTHFIAATSKDGTISEPGKYAITIRVKHMMVDPTGDFESFLGSENYEHIGLFRPETMQVTLSRREDNLEELQMTFQQLDTFMPV